MLQSLSSSGWASFGRAAVAHAILVTTFGTFGCQGDDVAVVEPSARMQESATAIQMYVGQQQQL